jgi:hypothetical protein
MLTLVRTFLLVMVVVGEVVLRSVRFGLAQYFCNQIMSMEMVTKA